MRHPSPIPWSDFSQVPQNVEVIYSATDKHGLSTEGTNGGGEETKAGRYLRSAKDHKEYQKRIQIRDTLPNGEYKEWTSDLSWMKSFATKDCTHSTNIEIMVICWASFSANLCLQNGAQLDVAGKTTELQINPVDLCALRAEPNKPRNFGCSKSTWSPSPNSTPIQ